MIQNSRRAFTMLELVFVIVVIGILSAIAIPKFALTRNDAEITKARAEVAAMRSAIAIERQKRVLKGNFADITDAEVPGLLEYSLSSKWSGLTYTAPDGKTCTFKMNNNKLVKGTCNVSDMSDL